jgi:hypothetical protein
LTLSIDPSFDNLFKYSLAFGSVPFTDLARLGCKAEGVSTDELIARTAALTAIDNLTFLDTNCEIDLLALALIRQYGFTSIFDAYYAATALKQIEDNTIISTDTIFDCITGIKRTVPREIKF